MSELFYIWMVIFTFVLVVSILFEWGVFIDTIYDQNKKLKRTKLRRGCMNIKNKMKLLFIMWIVNLLVFTTVLWAGYYGQHVGISWIKTPCEITLTSTGIAKLILSFFLCIGIFSGSSEEAKA